MWHACEYAEVVEWSAVLHQPVMSVRVVPLVEDNGRAVELHSYPLPVDPHHGPGMTRARLHVRSEVFRHFLEEQDLG